MVGSTVLDLFAGSGALGIEALSRGAAHVTFVDADRAAVRAVVANLATCGLTERATVVQAPVSRWLADPAQRALAVDLVLADPPYDFEGWSDLLADLRADLVVAEAPRPVEPSAGWAVRRSRRYGRAWVTLLEPHTPPDLGDGHF